MVQVSGAHQLRSTFQGKPACKSETDSSMWTIVLFGILTAIFAWVWYGGSDNKKEPDTQEQQQEKEEAVGNEQEAVGSVPDTLESEQRPQTAAITSRDLEHHAPDSTDAEVTSDVRSENTPEKEDLRVSLAEEQHVDILPNEPMQVREKLGHPVLLHEDDKLQPPDNVPQQEEAQILMEDSFIFVPDCNRVQTNGSPPDVPDKCAAESNVEHTPADVSDKCRVLISHVADTLPTDLQEKDVLQSVLDDIHPKDVQETNDLKVMEDVLQTIEKPVHPLQLHEENGIQLEGKMSTGNVPGQEEDPTHVPQRELVRVNEKELCQTSGFAQNQMHHIGDQEIVVLHLNGEEESRANAEEDNATGLIKEFSLALPEEENSETIPEAAKDIEDKSQTYENKVMVNESNIVNENHDGFPEQLVKQESFEQLKTDLDVDLFSTNHNDIAEITDGSDIPILSKSVSSKTNYESLTSAHILEDSELKIGQANLVLDKCNKIMPSSSQEAQSLKLEWSLLDEKSLRSNQSEAMVHEVDYPKAKRVAAVQPMPQTVIFGFKVHYITYSDSQMIAVTGDHEKLGNWEAYVPLTYIKDGVWSQLVTLPVDTSIEWKFVMVENGKIERWEECSNRCLKTAHDDIETQQWWGYP